MGLRDVAIKVGTEFLEFTLLCTNKNIAVLETVGFCLLVELHTQSHILHGDIAVTPPEENLGIDEEGQYEIHQHAANHNQQTLPCWFCTELPWLFRLFHLFRIKTFVNHAGYLAVAAQRNPADTIFCIAFLGFELKQAEFPVEENIKLFNPNSEEFGKEEVTTFVEKYQ